MRSKEVEKEVSNHFNQLAKLFFERMNNLWKDISLSDYIMTTVEKIALSESHIKMAARIIQPLIKLRTKIKKENSSNPKVSLQIENHQVTDRQAFSLDNVNFKNIDKLLEYIDNLSPTNPSQKPFQYICSFACYILELENEEFGVYIDEESFTKDEKVHIRVIQPAVVYYESLTMIYLLLEMLGRTTLEEFDKKVQKYYSSQWSDDLKEATKKAFEMMHKVWQHVESTKLPNKYQQSQAFLADARIELQSYWEKFVCKQIARLKRNKNCKVSRPGVQCIATKQTK